MAHLGDTMDQTMRWLFTVPGNKKHSQDSIAVIFHIQPVTDIQPLSINRQRLVLRSIVDHQRNQLLRELIRSIIVGATGNGYRQPIRPVIRLHQQIRRSLGRAIRARCMKRSIFMEEQIRPIQRQISVNLIRTNLVESRDSILPAG